MAQKEKIGGYMKNKELNINEIVKIETLPKIFYELEKVGEYLDEELEQIKKMDVSEESKQSMKKVRTKINDTLKQFEDKRKEINKCLEAYTLFEEKYNDEVKIKLTNASEDLTIAIDGIERKQIEQKEDEIFAFIDENIHANHIEKVITTSEVIIFANLKINLSTSIKSLKENAKAYIEKVAMEVRLIELEDKYSYEILLEYQKNGYNFNKAKLDVITKYKELEELVKQREQVKEVAQQEEVVEKVVEEIVAPKEVIQEDELLEVTFTVRGTKPQILKIKDFLIELGVEYK